MGKKVSSEITTNGEEGLAHYIELTFRLRTEENQVEADPDTENGPLGQLEDKAIKDRAESSHVENGNTAIKRVGNKRFNPTNTSKAKGRSRNESIMTTDLQHRGEDHALPKSYTRGEASHQTPDDGSKHTNQPTELIEEHEQNMAVLRRFG